MPNLLWISLALLGSPHAAAPHFDSTQPFAVVELYTSEGCSSCPPAEAYLNQLAGADNGQVLALAFHVDYWDYLGWRDPLAEKSHSERQRAYNQKLTPHRVYTPQMFVNGRAGFVGSDRTRGDLEIARALKQTPLFQLNLTPQRENQTLRLQLTVQAQAGAPTPVDPGDYWLNIALIADRDPKLVQAGENRGRRLYHANAVHLFRREPLSLSERKLSLRLPVNLHPSQRAVAVYVQHRQTLAIAGAATASF